MKIRKALPNHGGTMSGRKVSIQPRCLKSTYCGIMITGKGISMVLSTMLIPFPVIMIPQYVLFKHLGWIDTFLPLIVPPWFGSAFLIFMMRQFYLTIPRELDDA